MTKGTLIQGALSVMKLRESFIRLNQETYKFVFYTESSSHFVQSLNFQQRMSIRFKLVLCENVLHCCDINNTMTQKPTWAIVISQSDSATEVDLCLCMSENFTQKSKQCSHFIRCIYRYYVHIDHEFTCVKIAYI